jgi:hypothetical protein
MNQKNKVADTKSHGPSPSLVGVTASKIQMSPPTR